MAETKQRSKKTGLFIFIAVFAAVCMLFSLLVANLIDNDSWWLLALGENIIESREVPTTEPLSMHEGLDFVAQQWLSSVVFRYIYNSFGYIGLISLVLGFCILLTFLIHKLCTVCAGHGTVPTLVASVIAAVVVLLFGTSRPHLITYCILLTEMIFLEKYTEKDKWQYLIPLPILSVLEINLHSAMWWMLMVVGAPYVGEYIIKKVKREYQSYKLYPLLLAAGSMLLTSLINPYGLNALTYVFRSYGNDVLNSTIIEMTAPSMQNGTIVYVLLLALLVLPWVSKKRKLPIRYILFSFGMAYIALSSMKGVAYMLLFSAPIVAYAFTESVKQEETLKPEDKKKPIILLTACILASCLALSMRVSVASTQQLEDNEINSVKEALDIAEEKGVLKEDSVIYGSYNNGGFLEFKGYKPYLDARAEVFLEANNHKADIFYEAHYATMNYYLCKELVEEYDFDVIFVSPESLLYECLSNGEFPQYYELCNVKKENANDGTAVWVKAKGD